MYDLETVRRDFPILSRLVHGRPLVYLDNAATTQKPLAVLDAMRQEYLNANANVHRGVHYLSQLATQLHEAARERVRSFIGARSSSEVVFTRGTTEAINLVAQTFCQSQMKAGEAVVVTDMEHHSNIVPWQMQAQRCGIMVKHVPITDDGLLLLNSLDEMLTPEVRLLSLAHVSNVLGTVNPVADIIAMAHDHGIPVLVDAAQSVPHLAVDVSQLDCDFLAFSGHKMYGPTGVGVLYGKEQWLDRLPPYQGGGEMISRVSWEGTTYNELPFKFEAGTPDYVATHGLATAIDYISALGMDTIHEHEQQLVAYCEEQLSNLHGLRILGPGTAGGRKDAVVSFVVDGIHPLDMGTLLDQMGVAVRTGHHCAQPLLERLGLTSTVRASFALYNTRQEVDALVAALQRVIAMLS